jgi:hypothetical protein
VALVGGGLTWMSRLAPPVPLGRGLRQANNVAHSGLLDQPPLHYVANPHRLLPAASPPAGSGGYKLRSSGRWDPCEPITYRVAGTSPVPGGDVLLESAIAEVSRDTGLKFVDGGSTTETPREGRRVYEPSLYPQQWAPVLVAWTDQQTVPRLRGGVDGLGGDGTVNIQGNRVAVSGIVYLDGPDLLDWLTVAHGRQHVRQVMLHELGHLVGLEHMQTKTSVMYPEGRPQGPVDYSPGDRRGLAAAGSGPCQHNVTTG